MWSGAESELIARAKADPAAFGDLYRRHVDRIYSYTFHRVGNHTDAEDLTARTFHRALVGMSSYIDHGAPFSAWLYRIAHNLVVNWHRDRLRHAVVSLDCLEPEPCDEVLFSRAANAESIAAAVRSLEPDRQALLIMKLKGMSNAEIADSLGRSEGAVKSLYHRTLADLRDALSVVDNGAATLPTSTTLPEPLRCRGSSRPGRGSG
jgi:RNA polymerase sigma-70 factor (ECF subfamily)